MGLGLVRSFRLRSRPPLQGLFGPGAVAGGAGLGQDWSWGWGLRLDGLGSACSVFEILCSRLPKACTQNLDWENLGLGLKLGLQLGLGAHANKDSTGGHVRNVQALEW